MIATRNRTAFARMGMRAATTHGSRVREGWHERRSGVVEVPGRTVRPSTPISLFYRDEYVYDVREAGMRQTFDVERPRRIRDALVATGLVRETDFVAAPTADRGRAARRPHGRLPRRDPTAGDAREAAPARPRASVGRAAARPLPLRLRRDGRGGTRRGRTRRGDRRQPRRRLPSRPGRQGRGVLRRSPTSRSPSACCSASGGSGAC